MTRPLAAQYLAALCLTALCLAALCFACLIATCAHAGEVLYYPRADSPSDRRNDYALALLQLALREAHADIHLVPSDDVMTQARMFSELREGRDLQILWVMTTRERERQALAIRIPVYKGLIGWRLLLVHASHIDLLAHVHSRADLAHFEAGQARDWPDTDILRANHLPVVAVSGYENLFSMLGADRFDYMPRSVQEIWDEAQAHRADGAVVDPYLVLHYPAAVYFFVNRSNTALAKTIETGLNRALANGKFNRLFYSYFAAAIERADIADRTVINLTNPSLPADTPLQRKALWVKFPRSGPARSHSAHH